MPYSPLSDDRDVWMSLVAWGESLRGARQLAGLSQELLEHRSGVDQSQISRFERALAPRMTAERLVRVALVLRGHFPLGFCPHDHGCIWQRRSPSADSEMSLDRYREWRRVTNATPAWGPAAARTEPVRPALDRLIRL